MEVHRPTSEEIKAKRLLAGKTQKEAAEIVHLGSHQRWAEYEKHEADKAHRNIELSRWELFLIKTGQHDDFRPIKRRRTSRSVEDTVIPMR